MKGLRVKIFKEKTFEVVWGELEAKKYFQRQSFSKYLRKFLFLFLFFKSFFASINRIFIFTGGLGTKLSFDEV